MTIVFSCRRRTNRSAFSPRTLGVHTA